MALRFLQKTILGKTLMAIALCGALTACSTSKDVNHNLSRSGYNAAEIYDPLEPLNRAIFTVNGVIDNVVFRPVTQVYRAILPQMARDSIQSFLRNLRSPVDFANNLLQADMEGAGHVLARFLMNSTVGVVGLIDVAETKGYEYRREDFGQTLAVWGAGEGPYVVLPIIGPSNVRDTVGLVVDTVTDPITINNYKTDRDWAQYTRTGLTIVDTKARLMDPMDEIRQNSLDYYAAIRSIYTQFRNAQIQNRATGQNFASAKTKDAPVNNVSYDAYEQFEDDEF